MGRNWGHWADSKNILKNLGTFRSPLLCTIPIAEIIGCRGQQILLFQKLITETQISNPPEATKLHNFIKLVILLPIRAIYFRS